MADSTVSETMGPKYMDLISCYFYVARSDIRTHKFEVIHHFKDARL